MHYKLRPASRLDLTDINLVIERAIGTWATTERVKRQALPLHHYNTTDLDDMWLVVAESNTAEIYGITALEYTGIEPFITSGTSMSLHGLYVDPSAQGNGLGRRLLVAAGAIAFALGCEGLNIKAARYSVGFFKRLGLQAMSADENSGYPYRYWYATRSVSSHSIIESTCPAAEQ